MTMSVCLLSASSSAACASGEVEGCSTISLEPDREGRASVEVVLYELLVDCSDGCDQSVDVFRSEVDGAFPICYEIDPGERKKNYVYYATFFVDFADADYLVGDYRNFVFDEEYSDHYGVGENAIVVDFFGERPPSVTLLRNDLD